MYFWICLGYLKGLSFNIIHCITERPGNSQSKTVRWRGRWRMSVCQLCVNHCLHYFHGSPGCTSHWLHHVQVSPCMPLPHGRSAECIIIMLVLALIIYLFIYFYCLLFISRDSKEAQAKKFYWAQPAYKALWVSFLRSTKGIFQKYF